MNAEVYERKSLNCFEKTVGRNRIVKRDSGEGSEGSDASLILENMCPCKQIVGRNINIKYASSEASKENEGYVI